MTSSKPRIVRIQTNQQNRLTPAQKKFNTLIQKIDTQKKLLTQWQEIIPLYHQKISEKLTPLRAAFADGQAEMLTLLDTLFLNHKFTKQQQSKISHLITGICTELIRQHGRDDLKAIYARYSGANYDEVFQMEREAANDFLKSMFEYEYGVDMSDEEFDFTDLEETTRRLQQKTQQQRLSDGAPSSRRKKTSKQLAKEAREREEAANVSKSIQAVYRQLVAALHPDRESDPEERERKTDLMKQITVAYGNRDLLRLLELQLNVEQIDQMQINNITEDRLKYYNKILQNQLGELAEEVMLMELKMKAAAGCEPYEHLSPQKLLILLKKDIHILKGSISDIQQELQSFKDINFFKSWLKQYKIPSPGFDQFF